MRSPSCTEIRWMWPVTVVAITVTVIGFRRCISNERIAHAIAVGVARRRAESAASNPTPPESSPK